jgi:phosphate-selective porin OprO/OprP
MSTRWLLILFAVMAGLSAMGQDSATNTTEEIKWLRQKVEELEQKVRELQNANKTLAPANPPQPSAQTNVSVGVEAEAKTKALPELSLGGEGFTLSSADKDFILQFKGILQVDSRTFFNDTIRGNDTLLLRRARPILQGTVYRDFDFVFAPDFGGTSGPQIFDAYINFRYRPELQLRIGKFKSPIGLELLQSDPDTFFNERALPTDLVPSRDMGVQLHGELFGGAIAYAVGIFNGIGDTRSSSNFDIEDDKAFEGRLFLRPFINSSTSWVQGLGFGVGGSYESMQATNTVDLPSTTGGNGTLTGYTTDGQQQFFTYNPTNGTVVASGDHWRVAPQAYYYFGPFGFLGEYTISDQRVSRFGAPPAASVWLSHYAWQIAGSWILTGEDATYGHLSPRTPFDPLSGGWGAFQLVARYAELHIDEAAFPLFSDPATSAHFAGAWAVGLNWYLNRNIMIKASFSHTDFHGGGRGGSIAPGNVTHQDENVFFTRAQLAF